MNIFVPEHLLNELKVFFNAPSLVMRGMGRRSAFFLGDDTIIMYTIRMLGETPGDVYKGYFGVLKFTERFPNESSCEQHLIELKYP